ncbi:MAG TPA: nucleotide pyrophosphohydrolase [Gemmatimonadales bacterium]|nr:nucleotide pyrophosphohydrolase [Gemmatimonadales bacterium]
MAALLAFRHERDWEQFHTPKNLAIAISVEAAELLEHFQWTTDAGAPSQGDENAISEEIADVAILLTYLTHDLGIDLDAAVARKLAINGARYPLEQSRGTAKKYRDIAADSGGG